MFLSAGSRARPRAKIYDDLPPYQLGATATSGNNLVIALSQISGAPAPFMGFRDPSSAKGDQIFVPIPNGATFTINSGNTMGAVSGSPFRLWILGYYLSGGMIIGATNCISGGASVTAIAPLDETSPKTTSGGNGGSSAATFYASLTLTGASLRILGYMEWSSGLATAGTWNIAPTKIQLFGPGIKKPGEFVSLISGSTTLTTTTTSATYVVTSLTASISPTSAANIIRGSTFGGDLDNPDTGNGGHVKCRLGRTNNSNLFGGEAGCLGLNIGIRAPVSVSGYDKPGTTSSTTYTLFLLSYGSVTAGFNNSGSNAFIFLEELMG